MKNIYELKLLQIAHSIYLLLQLRYVDFDPQKAKNTYIIFTILNLDNHRITITIYYFLNF
jgi:hypothetical protein